MGSPAEAASAEARPAGMAGGRRDVPGLDGLRALAVVAAMAFHADLLPGGFLGVDLFFVVSGFLITDLLLEDAASEGRVRLGRFWARRVRRLGPALLLVLVVVLVWAYVAATPSMAQTTTQQLGWSLAYLANWFALFGDVGYWGADAAKTPLNHLWSLAIEEQFYVVWPLVVAAATAARRTRHLLGAVTLGGLVASGAWQWWAADHAGTDRAYLGTDTRAVALLVGCAIAVLVTGRRPRPGLAAHDRGRPVATGAWDVAVVAAVAWLGWWWLTADLADRSLYHGWLASCSVAAGVLVVAVVNRRTAWYSRALSAPPLVWIGRRSYSLYLWHWPIWVMVSPTATGLSGAGLWAVRLGLTAVAATASYAWVEQPIRRGWGSGRRLVTVGGVAVAAMAVAVVVLPPTLPPALRSDPVTLGAAGGTGSLDILVVGDSWARNLGFALDLADPASRNTYTNLGIGGCGLLVGTEPGCIERQRARWGEVIASRRPDAILLVTGSVDQGLGARLGGRLTLPCDPVWDAEYARRLDEAITLLRGGPAQIPVYVATGREAARRPEGSACVNRLLVEAAERHGAKVLDLHGKLCPGGRCSTTIDGRPLYDDTDHLAPAGQRWIGGWVLGVLRAEVAPRAVPSTSAPAGPCAAAQSAIPVASYSSSPDPVYPDTGGRELVDGRRGRADIDDPAWQGSRGGQADIVVTLAASQPVCAVASSWLQVLGANVQPPPLVDVYVSDVEGQLGSRLGSSGPPRLSPADQSATIRVAAGLPVTGRFVTIRVSALAEWSFADEVTVFGPP
jgi:peptidoglycan/LPS O-acetylase OafA/YrhL/lysophospholipase L1-like esterase